MLSNPTPTFAQYTTAESTGKQPLLSRLALLAVLLFIFLIPWGDGVKDGLPALTGVLSFGLAGMMFVSLGSHRNYSFFHIFVLFLWSWALLTTMWTPVTETGLNIATTLVQIMLLPFLFTLVISTKTRLIYAYQSYVLGNIIGSSIIIYNYLNGIESPYYNRYGIQNIETDILGIILALSVPMAAYLDAKRTKLRYVNMLAIPIIFYAIFLTGTRTASIVAMLGIAYWLFSYRNAPMKIKAAIMVMAVISVAIILTFAPKASLDRALSSGKSISSGTLNYRTVIWKGSLAQWEKAPIVGTGLGSLGFVLNKEHVNYSGAHNAYIEILTEGGAIGLALYLLLFSSLFYYILQTPLSEKSFLLALFLVVAVSQTAQHTHLLKETWFALTMIAIHARLFAK